VQYAQGAYVGLLVAMLVYNLFLLIGTRDRTYAYYVLYTLFFGLIWVSRAGQGWEHLWSFSYPFERISSFVFIILAIVFGVLFGRHYLRTQQHAPRFHTFFGGVAVAAVACGVIGFLGFWGPAQTLLALTALVASIGSLAGGAIVYSRLARPVVPHRGAPRRRERRLHLVLRHPAHELPHPLRAADRLRARHAALAFGLADRINLAERRGHRAGRGEQRSRARREAAHRGPRAREAKAEEARRCEPRTARRATSSPR
jgi:hypothetical protein